jgi:hypothetical protein
LIPKLTFACVVFFFSNIHVRRITAAGKGGGLRLEVLKRINRPNARRVTVKAKEKMRL